MMIGTKFRCYPTKKQEKILLQWIGCQRKIYNAKVEEDRYYRAFAKKSLMHTGEMPPIDQEYSRYKSELTSFLSEVPSQILRNGAVKWKQAYNRFFRRLGGRPTIQKKTGKQSVWLTSELFTFTPVVDFSTGEITSHVLNVGKGKFQVGNLKFNAHKKYAVPASIHISINCGQWHVSFNFEDEVQQPKEEEVLEWLSGLDEKSLSDMSIGIDRGIKIPVAASNGNGFGLTDKQKNKILKQEKYKKKWQRIQARRQKGSSNWKKAKKQVAKYQIYATNVRKDLAHKISFSLVNNTHAKMFVFEELKLKNMTKKPKAKQDKNGKWLKNGARAKAGLNKALLEVGLGQIKVFTKYKAIRQGKLAIDTQPHGTSQECSACGHIHKDNRITQSEFVCLSCGHTENADFNAAKVIKKRGVNDVLSGKYVIKEKKKCAIQRKTVGAVATERAEKSANACGDQVRRSSGNARSHRSWKQETPLTSQRL